MQLSCSMCGGGVEVDGASLRQGFARCASCTTVHHVGPDGLVVHDGPLQPRDAPPGVRLERTADGAFLSVRGPPNTAQMRPLDLPAVAVLALGAGVFGAVRWRLETGAFLAIFTFLGALMALSPFRRKLTPIVVRGTTVQAEYEFRQPVERDAIQQLYVTESSTTDRGRVWQVVSLYALMRDGRRAMVAGPMASVAAALFVEEVIEGELGLLDRAVYGQRAAPSAADVAGAGAAPAGAGSAVPASGSVAAPGPAAVIPSRCVSCGAPHDGEALQARGWAVCAFCRGVSLAWPPGQGPALGAGGWTSVRVDRAGDTLTLTLIGGAELGERKLNAVSRALFGGAALAPTEVTIDAQAIRAGPTSTPRAAVERVRLVEQRLKTFATGVGDMARQQAMSGHLDLSEGNGDGASIRWEIVVDLKRGGSRVLLGQLADAREADRLRAVIADALSA